MCLKKKQEWIFIHILQLSKLFGDVLCGECHSPGLALEIMEGKQQGFSARLRLQCTACKHHQEVYTSPRLPSEETKRPPFDINRRMTLASHEIGAGHASLRKIANVMGMPNMHLKTFQAHDKQVTG